MAHDAVSDIKAKLDIVEVIASYVTLNRAGRVFKGLCPFHSEKTPSFNVSPERQAWHCFGCSEGGDIFTFVQKMERIDFRQALEQLADRAGVELENRPREKGGAVRKKRVLELNAKAAAFFEHVLWNTDIGAPGRELLAQRDVDEERARTFGVGFAPAGGSGEDALVRFLIERGAKHEEIVEAGLALSRGNRARDRFRQRFMFPIRDDRGEVIAFGGRGLGDSVPKYLNSPETPVYHKSSALYGIDLAKEALRTSKYALIVEGYFDVIAAHRAGIAQTVASSGTALTVDQVKRLGRYVESIVLCFDGDDAGIAATSRAVDLIAAERMTARIVVLPDGVKDPDDLVRNNPHAFVDAVTSAPAEWQVLLDRALSDISGATIDERRRAAERAVALLARIPEAATRDLYGQQAADRLGLSAAALAADVSRVHKGERSRPVRVSIPVAPVAEPHRASSDIAPPRGPASAPEEYIGAAVVQRPELASILTTQLGLSTAEITHPYVRQIVELALDDPSGEFPLHRLEAEIQAMAARLALANVPELDEVSPEAVRSGLEGCIRTMREGRIRGAISDLKQAGNPDPELLNQRLAELNALRRA